MAAALKAVKKALGPDAIVVSSRQLQKPGLMRAGLVEVTAALELDGAPQRAAGAREFAKYASADTRNGLTRDLAALRAELSDPARPNFGGDTAEARRTLHNADVEHDLAEELASKLNGTTDIKTELTTEVARELSTSIVREGIEARGVVALVGPTGVGKTTSIAKLAAVASLVRGKKVALISTDTYRIGAGEQLAAYANLIGVPFAMAGDRPTLDAALREQRGADLVLVDTAGRGVRDGDHIGRLTELFSGTATQIWLTLSATTRQSELRALAKAYKGLPTRAMIMTKLDEAAQLGALLNAGFHTRLPLAYVTHGQRVPEDVVRPSPSALAAALVDAATNEDEGKGALELGSEVQSWS
jgi:flagellar biosynthesis protein FlhF